MKKYKIVTVRQGEENKYLERGYEPFGVSPHDTSYRFLNTSLGKYETHHKTTDYIYLRKLALTNKV